MDHEPGICVLLVAIGVLGVVILHQDGIPLEHVILAVVLCAICVVGLTIMYIFKGWDGNI